MENNGFTDTKFALTAAAMSGDSGSLYRLVAGLMDQGAPFSTVLFDLLVGIELEVGSRWQSGDYLIAEEHAATATIETVVSLLAGSFEQPTDAPQIVVTAAEGDDHSLPGRMAAAYLLSVGYSTVFLGGNIDADDFREYLEIEDPDVVVLSCALPARLLGARSVIRSSHSLAIPVVVGGNGFGESGRWAGQLGADAWAESPRDIPAVINAWTPDIVVAEAGANNPSDELNSLVYRRAAVVSVAQEELERLLGSRPGHRLVDEIGELLSAIEAGLLVNDPQLVADMLNWQEAMLTAQGHISGRALVGALQRSLPLISPAAASLLTLSRQMSELPRR